MSRASWISFVSRRWFAARREGGGGLSSALAAAGIAVGVAALVVVLGVMNGFQLGFIDSILDVSSFHVRIDAEPAPAGSAASRSGGVDGTLAAGVAARVAALPGVVSVVPFAETRCLIAGRSGRGYPVLIRALPEDAAARDPVMIRALGIEGGGFPPSGGGLVVGAELARYLGLSPGSDARLTIVTAGGDEGAQAREVLVRVAGAFRSGYYDFDSGMALLSAEDALGIFPADSPMILSFGIKLADRYADALAVQRIRSEPKLVADLGIGADEAQGWRDYNRAFFGALRTEKTIMMLLVGLIFLVVGVNIFHSMRRAVAERSEDIAVLKALGAGAESIRLAFVLDGLAVGAIGAAAGLAVGLFVAVNVNEVLAFGELVARGAAALASRVAGLASGGDYRVFSPQYFYLAEVPVRVLFPETFFIVAAAVGSSAAAASAAASRAASLAPAEVLRYE
jgi:lipoprotein-releasing system permease protein